VFPASSMSVHPQTGELGRFHLHPSAIQRAFKWAAREARLTKHASGSCICCNSCNISSQGRPAKPHRKTGAFRPFQPFHHRPSIRVNLCLSQDLPYSHGQSNSR
jgi:hypothetical protein